MRKPEIWKGRGRPWAALALLGMLAGISAARAECLRPTLYFKPIADRAPYAQCSRPQMLTIHDEEKGRSFGIKLCPRFIQDAKIQGQATITVNGVRRVINVSGRNSQKWVLVPQARCSYGYGVRNLCLVPFVSIAADLDHHDPGDVIFVKALKGTKVPHPLKPQEWWTHDGYLVVTDRGGAIQGANRFDFFIGTADWRSSKFPWRPESLRQVNPGLGQFSLSDRRQCKLEFQKVRGDERRRVLAKYDSLLRQGLR